jgi:hypothetical protein
MLNLRITFLAGALAFACLPAFALELPDYGSKNFSPSGDTPSYFTNEAAPVAARTADATEPDWSAVDEMTSARPAVERTRSAHTHSGRHGGYAVGQRSGAHLAARSSGKTSGKATGGRHGKAARHASASALHTVN